MHYATQNALQHRIVDARGDKKLMPAALTRTLVLPVAFATMLALAAGAYAQAVNYSYDQLGRIVTVTYPDGKQIVYTYDAAGNRTQHVVSASTVNRAPVAVDDTKTATEGAPYTFDPRTNDSDPDGNALTVTNVSNGESGTATVGGGGTSITYTPTLGRVASDLITYSISDGNGMSASAAVTITIGNAAPTAVNDAITVLENGSLVFDPRTNDTDPGQDPLTITGFTNGTKGTVTMAGGTSLTFTPNANLFGTDSFTYTISDDAGGTSTATVSVTITSTNQAPVAVNDTQTLAFNTPKTFDPRTNDSDPDGDAFTITAKTNGTKGTVAIGAGGTSVTYTPTTGQSGADSFTYTISDPESATATGTVNINITPNAPPVAVNDQHNVTRNVAKTFDPRTNDSDPDYGPITITAKTDGTKGTVTIGAGGTSVTYTPNLNALGADSFTYAISDQHGATATATVSINIQATNTAPVAVADDLQIDGITAFIGSIDPRWNDTDANGDALIVTTASTGSYGNVTFAGDGVVQYTRTSNKPTANSPYKYATISYTISDGRGGTANGTINVTLHYALDCGGEPCP